MGLTTPQSPYVDLPVVEEEPEGTWYHSIDLPNGESRSGAFDLRGAEADYLGGYDFDGKRVLEIGPASGHLTFWMEKQGAELVCVEVPTDKWDIVPIALEKYPRLAENRQKSATNLNKQWLWLHHLHDSRARLVRCPVYEIPESIGKFDVAVVTMVLLHLRNPLEALGTLAKFADTIIVTDRLHEGVEKSGDPVVKFLPHKNVAVNRAMNWWDLSSTAIARMLEALGYDQQRHSTGAVELRSMADDGGRSDTPKPQPYFTVVAERSA